MPDYVLDTNPEDDGFSHDDGRVLAIAVAAMLEVIFAAPPHLRPSIASSFVGSYLVNSTKVPVKALESLTKAVNDKLSQFNERTETRGSA